MELRKYRPLTIAYSLELSSTMPCFSYSLIFNLNVWVSFNESSSLDCANISAGEIDSGSEVDATKITDVKQYNKENGVMWQLYSLWYFAAGIAEIWNSILALILLVLSCTIGMVLLIRSYTKIYGKYRVQ